MNNIPGTKALDAINNDRSLKARHDCFDEGIWVKVNDEGFLYDDKSRKFCAVTVDALLAQDGWEVVKR